MGDMRNSAVGQRNRGPQYDEMKMVKGQRNMRNSGSKEQGLNKTRWGSPANNRPSTD